jgi:alkylation response protein AidB-like acyl-CoA dehydrogenase
VHFHPTVEHEDLAETVVKALTSSAGSPRKVAKQLGLAGISVPEGMGGLGLGARGVISVFEGIGYSLDGFPWLDVVIAAPMALAALARSGCSQRVTATLRAVLGGDAMCGFATLGPDGRWWTRDADLVDAVIAVGPPVGWVPPDAWRRSARTDLVGRQRSWSAPVHSVEPEYELDIGDIMGIIDVRRVAAAAIQLGAGRRALDLALEHVKVRAQFGRPIGSFQAVKHRLADAHIALAMVRPLVWGAALSLDMREKWAGTSAVAALLATDEAARKAARSALQAHGAVGYTDECAVGESLNLVDVIIDLLGPRRGLRRELAAAMRAGYQELASLAIQSPAGPA